MFATLRSLLVREKFSMSSLRRMTNEVKKTSVHEKSLNLVQLIGRVGGDPRIAGTETRAVTTFSLATNEYQGTVEVNEAEKEVRQRVDWHRIVVFIPRLRELVERYLRQGDRVYVHGKLHYDMIKDKNAQDLYITSIIADEIIFLTKAE